MFETYFNKEIPMHPKLKGRRIAALAADGFHKVELVVPRSHCKWPALM
jgi:hypothetical protein